jgi:hypothetical protein
LLLFVQSSAAQLGRPRADLRTGDVVARFGRTRTGDGAAA